MSPMFKVWVVASLGGVLFRLGFGSEMGPREWIQVAFVEALIGGVMSTKVLWTTLGQAAKSDGEAIRFLLYIGLFLAAGFFTPVIW